jgi:muconolactone delta-isomerase
MKLLAMEIDVPDIPESAFTDDLLRQEAARVWKLYQSGAVREMYFRADRDAAILVLECANLEEAEALISSLPLVQRNLIKFEIVPLAPYPGFERLFVA